MTLSSRQQAETDTEMFYRDAMEALHDAGLPFMVGGSYALGGHTGIVRHTKDIDLFMKPDDCPKALELLSEQGFETEFTDPVWLGKAFKGSDFIDFVFRSGNGLAEVDDEWFQHAPRTTIFGIEAMLCPPEETIWSKAFTMERERFDGADIAHILLECGKQLDWQRLLRRFGPHWRVLLSHLSLFGFIYPSKRNRIPVEVFDQLLSQLRDEQGKPADPSQEKICRGPFLSRQQYIIDVKELGFRDARFVEGASLSPAELRYWRVRVAQENQRHLKETKVRLDETEKVPPKNEGEREPGTAA